MAVSTLNFAGPKTVNDRLIRQSITFVAGDDDYTGSSFIIPAGKSLTLAVYASAVGSSGTIVKLQGSMDNSNFVTVKDINVKTNTGDITAVGGKSETHTPSTGGDFPYYRIAIDSNSSNGSTGVAFLIEH